MIITKTPLRISFVGGGSDCPWFYKENPGAVISTTIDKYIYIAVNKSFDNKYRLHYSHIEETVNKDEIENGLIRETLKYFNTDPVEIMSSADIPSKTGLGSSSSYAVGLINALHSRDKEFLAELASELEIEKLEKPIGKQDQYAASFGGFNLIEFPKQDGICWDNKVQVTPIATGKKQIENNLLLFYTGLTRKSESIHQNIIETMSKEKIESQKEMVKWVYKLKEELETGNIDALGEIMHKCWQLKKKMSDKISNKEIDGWYDLAIKSGATGGKLLGAGGGGFMLFYAPKDKHEEIINALPLKKINFKFESVGSEVIYVSG